VIKHYPKLGNSVSKYVFVNSNSKETVDVNNAKPVAELTGQLVHRGNNNSSVVTNNFHRSKNNVFRFTASPQPDKVVSVPCTNLAVKKPPLSAVNKISHPQMVYVSTICVLTVIVVISENQIQSLYQLDMNSSGAVIKSRFL